MPDFKPKTFTSYAFGCRVNQAEKEELDRQLLSKGYQYDESSPDIYIINTCSVTNKAEREVRQHINQVRKRFPHAHIIITGCAATNWLKRGIQHPPVDHIIDNTHKEFLAEIIQKRIPFSLHKKRDKLLSLQKQDKYLNSKRMILKIQDGCHRYCSYCIVPYLRGMPRSVPVHTITQKIHDVQDYIQEVILAAINTEAYGYDTNESCIDLIQSVLHETHIRRLSFGSIHPWTITDAFLSYYQTLAQSPRFVDFFHIPLQSGSDKILGLMKRNYTRDELRKKLHHIKQINTFAFIGTDIIVGFLDETDKDFDHTYTFLEHAPIDKFHVFRYSQREHTAAGYMAKRLKEPTPEQKLKRSQALISLGKQKYYAFLEKHIGQTTEALVLEKSVKNYRQGLLSNQVPVVISNISVAPGSIQQVKIEKIQYDFLVAKPIS